MEEMGSIGEAAASGPRLAGSNPQFPSSYSPLLPENCPNNCHPTSQSHKKEKLGPGGTQTTIRGPGICDRIEAQLTHLGKGTTWLGIFLGQLCSTLLCLSAVTSVILTEDHVRLPNAQNFAFYLLLSLVFTSVLACRRGERNLFPVLRLRGWKYVLVALADVEGNFLMVKAYQFTTLTSVQLLDCFTIPTVLSLSWLILRIRFKVPHILGVFICLLGVSCLVWADVDGDGRYVGTGKERFIGDMMSLAGAFLHGISGVAQEFVVKTFDWVEFLGMLGVIGSLVAGIQVILLESSLIVECAWTEQTICLLGAYAVAQFMLYLLGSIVMKLSSATGFNLSLLSADFYALLVGIQLFEYKFHALFFLSFVLVMSGVILFSIKPTSSAPHLYRSLVREQATITTDLELIASGTSLPPNSYVDENYTSTFTGGLSPSGTTTHPGSNNITFPNHHHHHHYAHYTQEELNYYHRHQEARNGETYAIPEEIEAT